MSKTHKVVILLVLAAISSIIAGFSIYTYLNSTKGFIYCFNANYSAGSKITKNMFYSIKVDEKIIKSGQKAGLETYYITADNFEKVITNNEYLLNDVIKDEPLTFTDLALTSGTNIERTLSDGNMAVTIPISGAAAVTDKLRVGSIVNIYKSDAAETRLIFENMKIISRNDGDSISTVTFATSPDDTLDLINAANNYRLYFSLAQPVLDENAHTGFVDNQGNTDTESNSSNADTTSNIDNGNEIEDNIPTTE